MAIFKATFIKNNARKIAAGKEHIRYIQNRRGKDGEKITRTLFNADGAMGRWEAYRMIDEAESRSVMYRLVINFDAEKEDTHKDISIQEVTEQTMLSIEDRFRQHIQWVAAVHDDHTPLRHVHIFAILPQKLQVPDLKTFRQIATERALEQRRERDVIREHAQTREEGRQWERQR